MPSAAVVIGALMFRVSGYTFRGSNSTIQMCAGEGGGGPGGEIELQKVLSPRKARRKSQKLSPFEKREKMAIYPYTLKVSQFSVILGLK